MTGTLRVSPLAALIAGVVVIMATITGAVVLNVTHTPGVDTLLAVTVPTAASLLVSAGIGAHLRAQDGALNDVRQAVNGNLAPTVSNAVQGELAKVGLKPGAASVAVLPDPQAIQTAAVTALLTKAIQALTGDTSTVSTPPPGPAAVTGPAAGTAEPSSTPAPAPPAGPSPSPAAPAGAPPTPPPAGVGDLLGAGEGP